MNIRAQGDRAKRQGIAQVRRNVEPSGNGRPDSKSVRCENVAYFAVGVLNESNAGRAVRVILNSDHFRCDAVLTSFEIVFAMFLLVAGGIYTRRKPVIV